MKTKGLSSKYFSGIFMFIFAILLPKSWNDCYNRAQLGHTVYKCVYRKTVKYDVPISHQTINYVFHMDL